MRFSIIMNSKRIKNQALPLMTVLFFFFSASGFAAERENPNSSGTRYSYGFFYTPVYQFETDIDGGGAFDVGRHFFRFDAGSRVKQMTTAGISLGYTFEDWNFSEVETVAGASPWGEVHRPTISFPLRHRFANKLSVGFTPTIEFSGESGADFSDGLMYGATVIFLYPVHTTLRLGLGFGVFDRLEESSFFPYLIVDWKINEQFRVTNPFRAGPAGPAGLELIYSPAEQWELGLGGAYRSYRFRLSDDNAIQSGIGQNNLITAFARIQRRVGEKMTLDLAGGYLLNGQLSIEDREGKELQSADYDNAPFVALTFTGKL